MPKSRPVQGLTATPPTQQPAATVREVAAAAGVSLATVSRTMNGGAQVSTATAQAVREAAAALGFRPNLVGRRLRAGRSHTIGVMLPTLQHPVFAECLSGIEQSAQSHGQVVALTTTQYDPANEEAASERLLENRVDGLVLTVADWRRSPLLDKLDREHMPYVLVFNQTGLVRSGGRAAKYGPGAARVSVSVDNRLAARHMVEHLIELGHRHIRMIAGQFSQSDRARLRHRGYEDAMGNAGLQAPPAVQLPFNTTEAAAALHEVVTAHPAPTALFCSSDHLALVVMHSLGRLGRRVPQDVSVAGFDGVAIGDLLTPPLTTVVQPVVEIGRTAVQMLHQRLSGQHMLGSATLHHSLKKGGTAASPRGQSVPAQCESHPRRSD